VVEGIDATLKGRIGGRGAKLFEELFAFQNPSLQRQSIVENCNGGENGGKWRVCGRNSKRRALSLHANIVFGRLYLILKFQMKFRKLLKAIVSYKE